MTRQENKIEKKELVLFGETFYVNIDNKLYRGFMSWTIGGFNVTSRYDIILRQVEKRKFLFFKYEKTLLTHYYITNIPRDYDLKGMSTEEVISICKDAIKDYRKKIDILIKEEEESKALTHIKYLN